MKWDDDIKCENTTLCIGGSKDSLSLSPSSEPPYEDHVRLNRQQVERLIAQLNAWLWLSVGAPDGE